MRGQLFSLDLFVALSIFFAVIAMVAYFWLIMPSTRPFNIQEKANIVAEFLASTKLGDENILDCSKLYNIAFKNYDQLKTELNANPYDIWVELKDVSSTACPAIRPKLDVMLVLDVSGSMDDDCPPPICKITDAKNASKFFVTKLNESFDQAGLANYSTRAQVLQTLLVMTTSNKTVLNNSIDSLCRGGYNCGSGTTNIADGIGNATGELTSARARSDSNKIQILLSDGLPNVPNVPTATQRALNRSKEACLNNIKIYTISLGTDANRTLMQEIARITGGKEYYAPTSSTLQEIFQNISQEITIVSNYGKIAPSSVKNLASVVRIVELKGQKLQMIVRVYEPVGVEMRCV